jgi:alkylation response protein AidB-like acyl-CoA dehydrogenase
MNDRKETVMDRIDLQALAAELAPQFAEGASARDVDAEFVAGHYEIMKANRVFSAMIPADMFESGGGGARHSDVCAFLRAIGRACPSTALALSMHQHLVAAAIFNDAHGRPGRKLLEEVAGEETVLISTGANDWLDSSGTVTRETGGYRVSARKPFASGSPAGAVLVTSAPYHDPEHGWTVLHFPVPMSADGVSLAGDWDTLGMRATGSQSIILDNVFVADEAIVLKRERGPYHPAFSVILTVALPLIMSAYLGAADAAAAIAVAQAEKRHGDEVTPYLIGEMTNHLTTAELAVADMVALANDLDFEPSADLTSRVLVRKTIAANAVTATAEKALEATGGAGFYRRLGLERLLRDVHAAQFHPMQEKRQHRFTGRLAMGLDPIRDAAPEVRKVA